MISESLSLLSCRNCTNQSIECDINGYKIIKFSEEYEKYGLLLLDCKKGYKGCVSRHLFFHGNRPYKDFFLFGILI